MSFLFLKSIARIITGGEAPVKLNLKESDYLALEREEFMKLVKTPATHKRIEHTAKTGKPLHDSKNPEVAMDSGRSVGR